MATESHNLTPVPLRQCLLERVSSLLGDRWTLLVLREVFYGLTRFQDFQRDLAIPRTVLSDRLSKLVENGVLRRRKYKLEGQRARFEYRLTPKGADLLVVLVAMMQWGERHMSDQRPVTKVHLTDRDCGAEIAARLVCKNGHQIIDLNQIKVRISR